MTEQVKIGTYTGDGSAQNISLGWIPDHVEVWNATDGDAGWTWFNGMADGTAIAHASGPVTLASNGITTYAGAEGGATEGFTIGTGLSESGDTFYYRATRNAG